MFDESDLPSSYAFHHRWFIFATSPRSVPRMFPGVRKEVDSINVAKRFQDIALHGCVNNGDLSKGFELSKAAPGRHLPRRDEAAQQLSKIPHPTCLNIERHIPNHPGATRVGASPLVQPRKRWMEGGEAQRERTKAETRNFLSIDRARRLSTRNRFPPWSTETGG